MRPNAKRLKTVPVPPMGIEPQEGNTGNYSTKQQSDKSAVGKSELPPDLQKVIAHWDALPTEVKQTILTLVKHSRRRKDKNVL
jgi:hypothetical protein